MTTEEKSLVVKNEPRYFFLLANQINSIGSSPSKLLQIAFMLFLHSSKVHTRRPISNPCFFITSVFLWNGKIRQIKNQLFLHYCSKTFKLKFQYVFQTNEYYIEEEEIFKFYKKTAEMNKKKLVYTTSIFCIPRMKHFSFLLSK